LGDENAWACSDGGQNFRAAVAAVKLADLLVGLEDVEIAGASGDADVDVAEVRDDSRLVGPGDSFVAIPGVAADGRGFVAEAVGRRAGVLVLERTPDGGWPTGFRGTVVTVPNARHALALMAANRFGPLRDMTLSAVTGTNGKTTTTYLVESILGAAGIRTGVIGTVAYRVGDAASAGLGGTALWRPAPLTTPGALMLHALLADMRAAGARDVVLEASSHALDQGRLDGCRFRVAGLTNLTLDHLDYHGSMDRYFDAKAILFTRLLDAATGVAVVPVDLPEGQAMRARVLAGGGARAGSVLGISAIPGTRGADVVVESVTMSAEGIRARLATPSGPLLIASPLVGAFNLANIVLAAGMGIARGIDPATIAAGIDRLSGVPGRLQRVPNQAGVLCVVDYAHTSDALERALAAVRPFVGPAGRLITVFGCGGDRDRTKRPLMGRVAAAGSELAIVTSDNPRGEDPDAIIAMILRGVLESGARELTTEADLTAWASAPHAGVPDPWAAFHVVADRRVAIQRAVSAAQADDVVLIAGKGHEDYQIVGRERIHFDDREEAAGAFAAKASPSTPLAHGWLP
jgi:UDP-N-acetylmuramoyl-L-alanyl-D-glutamate--2,6-diaminopimelate ligase